MQRQDQFLFSFSCLFLCNTALVSIQLMTVPVNRCHCERPENLNASILKEKHVPPLGWMVFPEMKEESSEALKEVMKDMMSASRVLT